MDDVKKIPPGWDEAGIEALIHHYDNQTEDEQAEEIEATIADNGMTLIAVPVALADKVRALLVEQQAR